MCSGIIHIKKKTYFYLFLYVLNGIYRFNGLFELRALNPLHWQMCSRVLIFSHRDLPATPWVSHLRSQFASNTSTGSLVRVSALNQCAVFPRDARWNNSHRIHSQLSLKSRTTLFFLKESGFLSRTSIWKKKTLLYSGYLKGRNH